MSIRKAFFIMDDLSGQISASLRGRPIDYRDPGRQNLKRIVRCLKDVVPNARVIDTSKVVSKVKRYVDEKYYRITLDGRVYFQNADWSFRLSRTIRERTKILADDHAVDSRDGEPSIEIQARQIANHYAQHGHGRPVVLCDDGIGTGNTLSVAIRVLRDSKVQVDLIAVIINPGRTDSVEGIDVRTAFPNPSGANWVNSRDLIFGGRRSGATFAPSTTGSVWGIPYSLDRRLIEKRIGILDAEAIQFRECCLTANKMLWAELEQAEQQNILLRDVDRISILAELLGCPDVRICEFLDLVNKRSFSLERALERGRL